MSAFLGVERLDGTLALIAADHITVVDAIVKVNRAGEVELDEGRRPVVIGSTVGFVSGATLAVKNLPEEIGQALVTPKEDEGS